MDQATFLPPPITPPPSPPAVVADAGAGGQVLMDQATFLAVKERLEELGAVDHTGLNTGRLNKLRPPMWMCW